MKISTLSGTLYISVSILLVFSFFKDWYVPSNSIIMLTTGLLTIFFVLLRYKSGDVSQFWNRVVILGIGLNFSVIISNLVLKYWTIESFITAHFLSKVILFLLTLIIVYLWYIGVQAERSYKKKIGNQRIQSTKPKGFISKIFAKSKKEQNNSDVILVLGQSADNEN